MKYKETPLKDITAYISKGIVPKYASQNDTSIIRVLNQRCNRNNLISLSNSRFNNLDKRNVPNEKVLKENDVRINSTGVGTAGRVAQVNDLKEKMTVDGHMIIIRPTKTVNPVFYGYAVIANQYKIEQLAEGSTGQTEINRDRLLKDIYIKLPSLDIQNKIANNLRILDNKISLNNQINANLQKLASTYFQFFLKKIETTNVLLEEVANIKSGGDKPKDITSKKDSDHLIPIFSNGMTNEGLYGYTKIAKIKEKAITVSARGTIGYTCLRTEPYFPIVRLISVIPYPKISVYYLYLWLLNTDIQGFGTTQQQLTVPVFKKYSVSIPKDLKDMSFFDNHVSVFFEQIQKNKEETKLLKEIKESLLKKLF